MSSEDLKELLQHVTNTYGPHYAVAILLAMHDEPSEIAVTNYGTLALGALREMKEAWEKSK